MNMPTEWKKIQPSVNSEAEFFEILNDFGNPLEIVREAISNAIDANASQIRIEFAVKEIEGTSRSVIRFEDDGTGMTEEALSKDFWGLGHSKSRNDKTKIGEKGHGTKIFLRSQLVEVKTQGAEGAFWSICDRPLSALSQNNLHAPRVASIATFRPTTGTEIEVTGYNDNERSKFVQNIVKDYILWFTKIGSIERVFGIDQLKDFKVYLKCIDKDGDPEQISFGHIFPPENADINKLFEEFQANAAGRYVKRYLYQKVRLANHPEVVFDAVISVEGDDVKRAYNPMIREKSRAKTGAYKVSDRYGLWLCKDYIPISRVNDWVSGFGTGSNAIALLHGFINCQSLKLTANRGTIANTDPKILEELQQEVQRLATQVDTELNNNGLYTLRGWQDEERTLGQERTEFTRRVKSLKTRRYAKFKDRIIFEPHNESECFGLLTTLVTLEPSLFEFEPLDYNTTKGIDFIIRDKRDVLSEHSLSYAELKLFLGTEFNHAFRYLRWIIAWDFPKNIVAGIEFQGIEEGDKRRLSVGVDAQGHPIYWLDSPQALNKVQVVRLSELLKNKLNLTFQPQDFL